MRSTAFLSAWLLLAAPVGAGPGELVDKILSADRLARAAEAFPALERLAQAQPQALRKALVDTGLLEALNRLDLSPRRPDGALDPSPMAVLLRGEIEGLPAVLSFDARGALRIAQLALRVPVLTPDREGPEHGWSAGRLAARKRALASLARFSLEPLEKDAYGNVFVWKGRAGRAELRAWYRPERDELRVVLVLPAAG
ncbi:MAG: hypothetical protein JXR96_18840 [Deltaproteobacteria bacterium]|nr:hypothetical protein [Deltaproteobacteria bacterium]